MHNNQQTDTYPENFRALALTVLAGEATRKKYQGSEIRTGPLRSSRHSKNSGDKHRRKHQKYFVFNISNNEVKYN